VEPGTVLGAVLPSVLAEVGLKGDVPVIAPGSHDTASAVAAIPGLDEDSVYISSGTWSLMGVEISEPVISQETLALNFTNEGGVGNTIRLLKNITGLWLLQESRSHWQREGQLLGWDELMAKAQEAEPFRSIVDPDAASFLNPGNMIEAIQAYCRNTGQPQPETIGQIVRCCLESLALRYRWVLEALEGLVGRRLQTIRIVGGGSQNGLLSQFAADACQRSVVTGPVEATALGNVMLQAIATGHLPDLATGRKAIARSVEQVVYEPGPADAWDAAYARFGSLVER
jgi:rhamnulokinase